jgi:hypothetical protein
MVLNPTTMEWNQFNQGQGNCSRRKQLRSVQGDNADRSEPDSAEYESKQRQRQAASDRLSSLPGYFETRCCTQERVAIVDAEIVFLSELLAFQFILFYLFHLFPFLLASVFSLPVMPTTTPKDNNGEADMPCAAGHHFANPSNHTDVALTRKLRP